VSRLVSEGYQVHALVRGDGASVGGAFATVGCDIRDDESVAHAMATVVSHSGGRLDALVHCAGTTMAAPVETMGLEAFRDLIATNLFGSFSLIRHALPLLRAAKGRLVVISSLSAHIALPLQAGYCASKAALEAMLDALRRELTGSGVHVSILEPGGIRTRMGVRHAEEIAHRIAHLDGDERLHYGRLYRAHQDMVERARAAAITPEEVVETILLALRAGRPRPRYRVGEDARLLLKLHKQHSDQWMDAFITDMHGLGHSRQ
jgi:NAD(P)-dependent dehydrogenase (short-subunit alcohol dehydrogenase family)